MDIRELNETEKASLLDALHRAARIVDKPLPLAMEDIQKLYDHVVDTQVENVAIQIVLGLAFGQCIIQQSGYDWVRLSDEYGDETAISPQGIKLNIAPISIIQKRVQAGVKVNLAGLADQLIKLVEERIASGEYAPR